MGMIIEVHRKCGFSTGVRLGDGLLNFTMFNAFWGGRTDDV